MPQSFMPHHPIAARPIRAVAQIVALGLLLAIAAVAAGGQAHAATPAEQFVKTNVEKGLSILNNKKLTDAEQRSQFRDFLIGITNIRRTALFTLGAARRTATPDEVNAFVDAFRDYAIAIYQARLTAYSGQTLKITGSTERGPGDFVVTTLLVDPSNSGNQQPIQIDFRVDQEKGGFVVLDASVVGVWLAIEERDQFTSFLAQHNNNVSALVSHLKDLTAKIESAPDGRSNQASMH